MRLKWVPVVMVRPRSLITPPPPPILQGWSFRFLLCEWCRVGHPQAEGEIWKSPLCRCWPASRRWYVYTQTMSLSVCCLHKWFLKLKLYIYIASVIRMNFIPNQHDFLFKLMMNFSFCLPFRCRRCLQLHIQSHDCLSAQVLPWILSRSLFSFKIHILSF